MGKMIAAAVTLVAALFLVGLFVPAVDAAPAEEPVWQKGDKWALGWDQSFSIKNNATVNTALVGALSGMLGMSFEEAEAEISAGAAIYVLFEVTDVTDDTYIVSTKLAIKLEADAEVSATGNLPKPGTYSANSESSSYEDGMFGGFGSSIDLTGIPTEEKTASVELGADFAFVIDGTTVFNKTTLAVESIDFEAKASAIIGVKADNIPKFDQDEGNITIAYTDYDIDLKAVLTLDMSIVFAPEPLNLFDFPLNGGDTWNINTQVNVSGEIGGFIDATGLPEDIEEEIFASEMLQELKIIEFPIYFVDLIPEDSELSDGKFGPFVEDIHASLSAEGQDDGTYEITTENGFKYYYDPDRRFLSGAGISLDLDEMPVDTSDFMPFLEPVTPSKASAEIDSITSYQADLEKRAGSDNVTDFFFDPPYLGLILIVVAAVVVGGALFMFTRAKKP